MKLNPNIKQTELDQIGFLLLDYSSFEDFLTANKVTRNIVTFYRNISYNDLALSMFITERESEKRRDARGVHVNIMKNGDIHARVYPYYDGTLDNLIMCFNQRKIYDICFVD